MTPQDGATNIGNHKEKITNHQNVLLAEKNGIVQEVREKIKLNPMSIEQLTTLLESDEGVKYFEGKLKVLQCMDGRINGGDGMAGSGILLERDKDTNLPAEKYMSIFRQRVNEGKLEKIAYHKDCGAAKLYLKNNGNASPMPEEVDAEAESFSRRLADHLGIPAIETQNEFPNHDEQGIYIDATDRFNEIPADAEQLPNGFVLSPLYTNDFKYHLSEIEVAIGIAFGDHGAGADAFSPDRKYFIMLINDSAKPGYFEGFKDQIRNMIQAKFPQFAEKIDIREINPKL